MRGSTAHQPTGSPSRYVRGWPADQPVDGLAPQTQAELLWRAVQEDWDPAALREVLRAHAHRRGTDA